MCSDLIQHRIKNKICDFYYSVMREDLEDTDCHFYQLDPGKKVFLKEVPCDGFSFTHQQQLGFY